jgi:tRNA pseudouridine55 synthase
MARRRKGRAFHGWLVVDKPAGMTSAAAVARVQRALDARKAGHAGTLDPDATGLLAVAFGEATKTMPYVSDGRKTYRFEVAWGTATTTDDAGGEVVGSSPLRPCEAEIRAALPAFTGDIMQVPPRVSAVKLEGKRAYELARAGEAVEIAARPLQVARLDLMECRSQDSAVFEMVCGKGGYVRSIARDLGETLGSLGHVRWLRRLRAEPFGLEQAVAWPEVEAAGPALERRLLPVQAALAGIACLDCPPEQEQRLRNGNPVALTGPSGRLEGGKLWVKCGDRPMATGRWTAGLFHPERVFVFD